MKIEKDRFLLIDGKRITFLLVFVASFVVTELGRRIYRPYIYANDIFDFWIADTIGNLTGSVAVIFFSITFNNPRYPKGREIVLFVTVGLIAYELWQYFSPRSRLDWRDIVATLIAGTISLVIYELIYVKQQVEERTEIA